MQVKLHYKNTEVPVELPDSVLVKKQEIKETFEVGSKGLLKVTIRYDDCCNNGHNSFAITADYYENGRWDSGGCLHDMIAEHAPKFAHLIKWHLCSSDGPLHYLENTVYLAGDRDCWGYRKGEQKRNKDGKLMWASTSRGYNIIASDTEPTPELSAVTPILGEGKERELDSARNTAIWPEATDEELMAEPAALVYKLTARLPGLVSEFKQTVESLGFTY